MVYWSLDYSEIEMNDLFKYHIQDIIIFMKRIKNYDRFLLIIE